ncbi:MAG TPA: hypothetical protein VKQ08_10635, partial [Cyclobacteriaceae bacterium]|nr:hypothetical protein [Cyclobacteriaceae bacterium]
MNSTLINRALFATTAWIGIVLFLFSCRPKNEGAEQIVIGRIAIMPDYPEPYKMTDWYEKAHNFDQYVFNQDLKGQCLPFIWPDNS